MGYSGRYQVKDKAKYRGDFSSVVYRSLWEKAVFQWCDKNEQVKGWSSEEVIVPYYYDVDKKYHKYYVDVKIIFEDILRSYSIPVVSVYPEFLEAVRNELTKNGEPVYWGDDTHWNGLGIKISMMKAGEKIKLVIEKSK